MIRGGFRLTSDEADQFRMDGYLVLRRVLDLSHRDDPPIQLFSANPIVLSVAEELLGHGLVGPPTRVRTLPPAAPFWSLRRRRLAGDLERHPFQLGVAGYLDDRPAGSGAITVWPGSHQAFHSQFSRHVGDGELPTCSMERKRWNARPGLEVTGQAGDAIFFHHRLLYAPGRGRRSRAGSVVLADFALADLARTVHEPPPEDMWWYWPGLSEQLRERESGNTPRPGLAGQAAPLPGPSITAT